MSVVTRSRSVTGVIASVLAVGLTVASCGSASTSTSSSSSGSQTHLQVLDGASVWLRGNAVAFDRTDPTGSLDDLEPLRQMVGDARIVSLGEATHGTREFFQMKHRVLRFLVERMGFTAFAIEATWPEANRLDRYVRTGEGDPAVLLSGLYFWTWNTDEVLQMIQWMRQRNATGGSAGFYGFDMQSPGMAIDNVKKFVASVDERALAEVVQHLECLARYANDPGGRSPTPGYAAQPLDYRNTCLQDLRWVQDTLTARRTGYESASSPEAWARAVQSARVAVQFEEMSSNRRSRDLAMADNVKWLLEQMPDGGKIVLWAHNGHVSTSASRNGMGAALRQMFGQQMVVMGFSFGQGTFNAVGSTGTAYTTLGAHTIGAPAYDSYEEYFHAARLPQFLLDLRGRSANPATPNWLLGPRSALSIGSVYADGYPSSYYYSTSLHTEYDVLIHIDQTTASNLLPMKYPGAF
jgi:erythromycin esterase